MNQSAIVLDLLPHLEINIDLQSIIEELESRPATEEAIPETVSEQPVSPEEQDTGVEVPTGASMNIEEKQGVEMLEDIEESVDAIPPKEMHSDTNIPEEDLQEEFEEDTSLLNKNTVTPDEVAEPEVTAIEEDCAEDLEEETVCTDSEMNVTEEQEALIPAYEEESKTETPSRSPAEMSEDDIKAEIFHLENLILGDPTVEGYVELAEFNILLKRYAHAERHLHSAIELEKNSIDLKLKMADVAMKQHNYARVVSCSLDIIHREFDNYQAHTLLGLAFIRLNKEKKAEKALKMALKFNPDCQEAQQALKEMKQDRNARNKGGFLLNRPR